MIGKIISGSSFSGTVGYVMKEKSRILEAEGIVPPDAKRMAEDFNDQTPSGISRSLFHPKTLHG